MLFSSTLLAQDQYIFGYGSLMNTKSRNSSDEKMQGVPNIPVTLSRRFVDSQGDSYVRAWNYRAGSGFTALGLRKVKHGQDITGVIYQVGESESDMANFDQREEGYTREKVSSEFIHFENPQDYIPADSQIWVYIPKESSRPVAKYPLLQSYIDICISGALEHSEEFAKKFITTTEGWDTEYWLDDRLLARRPWVYQKQYKQIHAILKQHTFLKNRKFSEEYAVFLGDQ
ncbi:gamma-glutamylcyclotransferase family protein [Candidatus Albibeggiatoa sp. nov. NOAA]|uniref:gamma-glutamylcyclotransferase family protein n=1 Tax=Candidatus Albibeggiatoa sp. nov. NOAA TaxID=3162724 RepID=UPI0032FDBFC0|nr:gamma-glutamylcyclotransferase [Thiotrichaceae bacterium]